MQQEKMALSSPIAMYHSQIDINKVIAGFGSESEVGPEHTWKAML